MKFPYVRFGMFYRPVIPVTFSYESNELAYQALVDTGADLSIVDAELAEELGLDFEKGEAYSFGGIVGGGIGYIHQIDVTIGGTTFKNIPICFSSEIAPQGMGILGHLGLFDKVRLLFEYGKKELEITPKSYSK